MDSIELFRVKLKALNDVYSHVSVMVILKAKQICQSTLVWSEIFKHLLATLS